MIEWADSPAGGSIVDGQTGKTGRSVHNFRELMAKTDELCDDHDDQIRVLQNRMGVGPVVALAISCL